jgi:NAD+ synthase|tara:strand:- start:16367 stop:17215 length:849 start_codon:yes stop_codon:yes gene_type:complete
MNVESSFKKILDEMKVLPIIDPQFEVNRRVKFIKSMLLSTGLSHLVLGISGGVDSATCGRLAQIAINELGQEFPERGFSFIALRLPYGRQIDEIDAQKSIKFICPSKNILIDIKPSVDATHERINSSISKNNLGLDRNEIREDFTKGNTKARIRMTIQYEVASALGGLVLGTDHSAENITGFYTKWGDGACDLAPLFGLNKRQVRKIAGVLNAPKSIIEKTPTADLECLAPQKEDEYTLGVSYNEIDDFLEGKPVAQRSLETIINLYNKTIHKRSAIPTIYD